MDTVKLWVPSHEIGKEYYDNQLLSKLADLEYREKANGEHYFTGKFSNLSFYIGYTGISISGSLAKYFLGTNGKNIRREGIKTAIQKLSDELLLPINNAIVTKMDIGHNFQLKNTPADYYPFLGHSNQYIRSVYKNSLYYSNSQRSKLFYDKGKEVKGIILGEKALGTSLMRYELRFRYRLAKQFQRDKILAKNLYDELFFDQSLSQLILEYEKIKKVYNDNLNIKEMKSPKDFWYQISLLGLISIGGKEGALQLVDQLKSMSMFKKREYYSRLKTEIRNYGIGKKELPELIKELDSQVGEIKNYYK